MVRRRVRFSFPKPRGYQLEPDSETAKPAKCRREVVLGVVTRESILPTVQLFWYPTSIDSSML